MMVKRQMEQRGRGWPLMRLRMREFNDTEPEIEEDRDARWVHVTLRLRPALHAAGGGVDRETGNADQGP